MTTIFDAAASGDIGSMNTFMDHDDFDIDAKDALGNTALHCAAKNGEAAAGGLLVECSADVTLGLWKGGEKGANAELLEMLEGAEKEMQVYSAKVEKDSGSKDMMSPD
eukprot:s449_g45.t1